MAPPGMFIVFRVFDLFYLDFILPTFSFAIKNVWRWFEDLTRSFDSYIVKLEKFVYRVDVFPI